MKIESSDLTLFATHRAASATVTIEKPLSRQPASPMRQDTVALSGRSAGWSDDVGQLDPRDELALLILESLLGHKIRLMKVSGGSVGAGATVAAPQARQRTEIRAESEATTFRAEGRVTTADGRSIAFSAGFRMTRQFQSVSTSVASAATTDPLVVNFGGAPARLTGAKVSFDLNSDGKPETVSFVEAGSGFLAIDGNRDGEVNDGGELFGPRTGNGFAELAAYDSDGNGWIDENDPVFSELRIWTQDGLYSLKEKGVGAISTGSVETPFAIQDGADNLQGRVRGSGVYLSENGTGGSIEQVDLALG